MACSRSLAVILLITRMFMFLLICLDNPEAAMGYYLLLAVVIVLTFLLNSSVDLFPHQSDTIQKVNHECYIYFP